MKFGGKWILCCLFGGSLVGWAVETELESPPDEPRLPTNPYQLIADRNVFGLKPVPPPPQPEVPKPPPPNIILSGITTLQGRKTAFLKTPPAAAKPGQPAKGDQYFMLSEGEMDREMRVLQIDDTAGIVKVSFAGTEMALNFTDNGAKPNATPPPATPGQPGAIPAPGIRPPGTAPTPGTVRPITLPTRPQRTTPAPAAPVPATTFNSGAASAQPNVVAVTSAGRNQNFLAVGGVASPNPVAGNVTEVHQLSPEQQFVLQEVERERTAELVNRQLMPPLPPTPLTAPGMPGTVVPTPAPGQAPGLPLPH